MEDYLVELPDGTVKQRNPFTGTEVWTVPGRGDRPLGVAHPDPRPLSPSDFTHSCAFCSGRYLDTPPEKSRVLRDGDGWATRYATPADRLDATVAEFRRVPNLFEILSYDYWHLNHGFELPPTVLRRKEEYLASPAGRAHVLAVVTAKLRASGMAPDAVARLGQADLIERASGFFGGGHDVVIARRHYVDGAVDDSQLASSGTLTPEEHARFVAFTVESTRRLYEVNPFARYVVVFQNWLKPAGASFDHLHKQLVAIDEPGGHQSAALQRALERPNTFNDDGVNVALARGLVIARTTHAVAFAGFGHRYPTIEVYSTSPTCSPWEQREDEVRSMADLLHAMHAATGADVATNEEWHYRPPGAAAAMPWRVMLKWRVSTLAGFEGASRIYLNTVSPGTLRSRVVDRLRALRAEGRLAPGLAIAEEADLRPDPLLYHR